MVTATNTQFQIKEKQLLLDDIETFYGYICKHGTILDKKWLEGFYTKTPQKIVEVRWMRDMLRDKVYEIQKREKEGFFHKVFELLFNDKEE